MLFLQLSCIFVLASPEITTSEDNTTLIVNNAPEQEVIAFGKTVIVKTRAKSALAIGGDVVVEGYVDSDVGAIGGNVIQKEKGYIGGDIIVFGGAYKPEAENPLREPGRETVMVGVFEEELRSFGQNPSQLFSPSFSFSFIAQRVVVALLWFVISLVFATVAPGAVSRAVSRISLTPLKVCGIGSGVFLLVSAILIGGAVTLPSYLAATVLIIGTLLFILSYVFGRVSLQVSVGKLVQKHVMPENNRSETLATLIGVLVWTLLLSLPYVWLIALFTVFMFGIGLIITGRTPATWKEA
jgi:hypothetical protein